MFDILAENGHAGFSYSDKRLRQFWFSSFFFVLTVRDGQTNERTAKTRNAAYDDGPS